jgi:RNA polymerase sigma factor (sigma-70 family)
MTSPSSRLRTVIDRLPFPVDDTDAANDAFRRWRSQDDPDAERVVDMWTYCYVCRYFLSKSAGGAFDRAAAPDELITRTFEKVQENRDSVRDAGQYASWVSVVCKNTFLNHTRRDRTPASIDDEEYGPTLRADDDPVAAELGFVREAFEDAIQRLPEYLRKPARLYFLEDRDFEEISEIIGKAVPTVRTYKHKALQKLREDDTLREYVDRVDL